MIVVPNEWLVELLFDMEGTNKVHRFLDIVDERGLQLAIRRTGRVSEKILGAMRDPQRRAKRLRLMLFDSTKVRLVEEDDIVEIAETLASTVPVDDLYLVETALSVTPCVLVTTDVRLSEVVLDRVPGLTVRLLIMVLPGLEWVPV